MTKVATPTAGRAAVPYALGSLGPAGAIAITGNSKAAVTVVTTPLPHGLVTGDKVFLDRKSTRLNSSHIQKSRMPSSA